MTDPVTAYARDVKAGRIIAGPHVRDACDRHLRDLKRKGTEAFPYRWNPLPKRKKGETPEQRRARRPVDRVMRYFSTVLRLNGGEHEGKPFDLHHSQAFIVGSIFGWLREDGTRRFRSAFIEQGKGSGKSPMAAAIGTYMLMADGEARAEVYAAAVDRNQASILFRDAVAMARQSPALTKRVTYSGGVGKEWNIAYLDSGSFFRPITSESSGCGKSGRRV